MTTEQRAWLVAASKDHAQQAAFPPLTTTHAKQLFAAEESFYETYYSYHQAWNQA